MGTSFEGRSPSAQPSNELPPMSKLVFKGALIENDKVFIGAHGSSLRYRITHNDGTSEEHIEEGAINDWSEAA